MDLIRTTDHLQNRPGFFNQNTAPRDLSKPITNLSEVKGAAQPRGRANATDTPPPSLIARMTKGVLETQRRRLANQPASSRDTRIAEHYKASYVLEDRGGATAPGAALCLRPTGKAAGGMEHYTTARLQELKNMNQNDMRRALAEFDRQLRLANNASTDDKERSHLEQAEHQRQIADECQSRLDGIVCELKARDRSSSSRG